MSCTNVFFVHTYICMYICIYMYMYMYIYTYTCMAFRMRGICVPLDLLILMRVRPKNSATSAHTPLSSCASVVTMRVHPLFACVPVCLSVCLPACLPAYLSVSHSFLRVSVCLISVMVSLCPPLSSVCLPVIVRSAMDTVDMHMHARTCKHPVAAIHDQLVFQGCKPDVLSVQSVCRFTRKSASHACIPAASSRRCSFLSAHYAYNFPHVRIRM
jgi:hypothetical protein